MKPHYLIVFALLFLALNCASETNAKFNADDEYAAEELFDYDKSPNNIEKEIEVEIEKPNEETFEGEGVEDADSPVCPETLFYGTSSQIIDLKKQLVRLDVSILQAEVNIKDEGYACSVITPIYSGFKVTESVNENGRKFIKSQDQILLSPPNSFLPTPVVILIRNSDADGDPAAIISSVAGKLNPDKYLILPVLFGTKPFEPILSTFTRPDNLNLPAEMPDAGAGTSLYSAILKASAAIESFKKEQQKKYAGAANHPNAPAIFIFSRLTDSVGILPGELKPSDFILNGDVRLFFSGSLGVVEENYWDKQTGLDLVNFGFTNSINFSDMPGKYLLDKQIKSGRLFLTAPSQNRTICRDFALNGAQMASVLADEDRAVYTLFFNVLKPSGYKVYIDAIWQTISGGEKKDGLTFRVEMETQNDAVPADSPNPCDSIDLKSPAPKVCMGALCDVPVAMDGDDDSVDIETMTEQEQNVVEEAAEETCENNLIKCSDDRLYIQICRLGEWKSASYCPEGARCQINTDNFPECVND